MQIRRCLLFHPWNSAKEFKLVLRFYLFKMVKFNAIEPIIIITEAIVPKDNNKNVKDSYLFSFLKELGFWKRSNEHIELLERTYSKEGNFSYFVPTPRVETEFVNAVCKRNLKMVECILGIWSIDLGKVDKRYNILRDKGFFIGILHHYYDLAAWHFAALKNNLNLLKLLIKGVDLTQKISYERDGVWQRLPVIELITNGGVKAFLAFKSVEYCLQRKDIDHIDIKQEDIEEAKKYMEIGQCHQETADEYRRQVLVTGKGYEFNYAKHEHTLGKVFPWLYSSDYTNEVELEFRAR